MAVHPERLGSLVRFADELRSAAPTRQQAAIKKHSRDLGLDLLPEEIVVYAALEEPPQVQEFINNNLPYNSDPSPRKESCRSPRQTLANGSANCFEGALFAFASNTLNKITSTRLVLLEARAGYDHNIVVYKDRRTKNWGCEEKSGYGSGGRRPKYQSIRAVVKSLTKERQPSLTTGRFYRFSEPIDLIYRFGTKWITAADSRYIYYHYIDQSVYFHSIFGKEERQGHYPLVEALRNKWITADKRNRSKITPENFPKPAQLLWNRWVNQDGDMDQLSKKFLKATGVTPLALEEGAEDFQFYLREGYRPEELLSCRLSRR